MRVLKTHQHQRPYPAKDERVFSGLRLIRLKTQSCSGILVQLLIAKEQSVKNEHPQNNAEQISYDKSCAFQFGYLVSSWITIETNHIGGSTQETNENSVWVKPYKALFGLNGQLYCLIFAMYGWRNELGQRPWSITASSRSLNAQSRK